MKKNLEVFLENTSSEYKLNEITDQGEMEGYIDEVTGKEYVIIKGTPTAIHFTGNKTILEWS
jgi:hypothetical protein